MHSDCEILEIKVLKKIGISEFFRNFEISEFFRNFEISDFGISENTDFGILEFRTDFDSGSIVPFDRSSI